MKGKKINKHTHEQETPKRLSSSLGNTPIYVSDVYWEVKKPPSAFSSDLYLALSPACIFCVKIMFIEGLLVLFRSVISEEDNHLENRLFRTAGVQ